MSGLWITVLIAATVLAVGLVLAQRDRAALNPELRRVCRALGISRSQRRALSVVARRAGLSSAASMLVSRGCFDHACDVARPGGRLGARVKGARAAAFESPGG
jgi:hypothetical protein